MKINAQAYQPTDGSTQRLPPPLENLREWALGRITDRMRVFGIAKMNIKPVRVGIRVVNEISFKPMSEPTIPQELLALRNSVVRAETEFMLSFGITEVELQPDVAELEQLRQAWANMAQYAAPGAKSAVTAKPGEVQAITEIPLNVEADPSGKNVLQEIQGAQQVNNTDGQNPGPA